MASKTKKAVLLSVAGLVLAAAVIGYTLYNKKHFNPQTATPVADITAAALHQSFSTDTTMAKNTFIGDEVNHKVIQVTGDISEIKKDQQGSTIILLKTTTNGAFVNCTLEGKTDNITVGKSITIKGICSGYNYDAEMGIPGDVIVTRSYIIK